MSVYPSGTGISWITFSAAESSRFGSFSALWLSPNCMGKAASEVAANVRLTAKTVREIGRRYQDTGLDCALHDRPRPGAAALLDHSQRQRIIAMVCADPPQGYARWTIRLVAGEAVKRKLVPGANQCGASPNTMTNTRDTEYERCGTANVFRGIEPQAGVHFTKVTPNRSSPEFADFIESIANRYPAAPTIHLVFQAMFG
jgi:Homeodomain-like domain